MSPRAAFLSAPGSPRLRQAEWQVPLDRPPRELPGEWLGRDRNAFLSVCAVRQLPRGSHALIFTGHRGTRRTSFLSFWFCFRAISCFDGSICEPLGG